MSDYPDDYQTLYPGQTPDDPSPRPRQDEANEPRPPAKEQAAESWGASGHAAPESSVPSGQKGEQAPGGLRNIAGSTPGSQSTPYPDDAKTMGADATWTAPPPPRGSSAGMPSSSSNPIDPGDAQTMQMPDDFVPASMQTPVEPMGKTSALTGSAPTPPPSMDRTEAFDANRHRGPEVASTQAFGHSAGGTTSGSGAAQPDSPPSSEAYDRTMIADVESVSAGAESMIDKTRDELVGLKIISATEWDSANQLASEAGQRDLPNILRSLTHVPARWNLGADAAMALTAFQLKQIQAGRGAKLRLQNYILLDRLGAGGMGEVFKARNLSLPRIEAVKMMLRNPDPEGLDSTRAMDRFEREAQVLAQMNHRYITTVYQAGFDKDFAYIAMEYVKGQDMKEIVEKAKEDGEPMPIWWAAERVIAIAEALDHAHAQGIIHRDIKPGNIMITEDHELKVLDMGIARLLLPDETSGDKTRLTQSAMGLGTPEVMPPEQWADATTVTEASDIYSLGCTFFYMLTGQMPFLADTVNELMFMHLNESPPSLRQFRKDVPDGLDAVIAKMLAKETRDRYSSCRELIDALWPFAQKDSVGTAPRAAKSAAGNIIGGSLIAGAIVAAAFIVAPMVMKPAPDNPGGNGNGSGTTGPLSTPKEKGDALVAAFQQNNAAIWTTPQQINAFVAAAYPAGIQSDGDVEELRKKLISATMARETLRNDANRWLEGYQKQHPEVWGSLASLQAYAKGIQPKEGFVTPKELDDFKKRIDKETTEKEAAEFASKVPMLQQEYFAKNKDAWDSADQLSGFVKSWAPGGQVRTPRDWAEVLKKLDEVTWQNRTERWVKGFQSSNSFAWSNYQQLEDFLKSAVTEDITSQQAFDQLKQKVELETSVRMQKLASDWLSDYQRKNATIWPTLSALQTATTEYAPITSVKDKQSFDKFTVAIEGLTNQLQNPFKGLKNPATGNPAQDQELGQILQGYQWLGGLSKLPSFPESEFSAELLSNGQPVTRVQSGGKVTLNIRSPIRGYVTLLLISDSGQQLMVFWKEQIQPKEDRKLIDLAAEGRGKDRYIVFVTDASPLDSPELKGLANRSAVTKFDNKPGYMRGMLAPLNLDQEAIAVLQKSFVVPSAYDRVLNTIISSKEFPTLQADPHVKEWCRKTLTLEVTN